MSDDKSKNTMEDRIRINVNENYELQYWSEKFGCTVEQLKAAVAKVGVMSKDVADELRLRK